MVFRMNRNSSARACPSARQLKTCLLRTPPVNSQRREAETRKVEYNSWSSRLSEVRNEYKTPGGRGGDLRHIGGRFFAPPRQCRCRRRNEAAFRAHGVEA